MFHTRIVPIITLLFSFLFLPVLLNAQGVGLNLGPIIVTNMPFATSPGFTVGLDYLYGIDDDGLMATSLQYSSFPVDEDEVNGAEFSSLKTLSLLTTIRFRIAADLDEVAPIITLAGGPAYRFGGTHEESGADLVGDLPFNFEGWIGAGVDWPLVEENVALIGQLRYPLTLQFVDTRSGLETDFVTPGLFFTVGIEYRNE